VVAQNEAAALVSSGMSELSQGTPEALARALLLFSRAVEMDPGFAPAYIGLTHAYLESIQDWRHEREWLERAVAAGEKAVELDPTASDAYLPLGIAYRHAGALRKELGLWQRRLELEPNDATARIRGGWVLWFSGRPDEALTWLDLAASQRPDDQWVYFFLGNSHLALGDFAQAVRSYAKALALYPDHSSAQAGVIWSLLAANRDEEARSQLRQFEEGSFDGDRYPLKLADIEYFLGDDENAMLHAREAIAEPGERYWPRGFLASTILGGLLSRGDLAAAEEELQSSEAIDRDRLDGGDEGFMPHVDLAAVSAIRGDVRTACHSLRSAIGAGWRYGSLAARDRLFENLHADDEFLSLLAR
jgi:tetratricopeptide (TPR) repeat protein